MDKIFEKIKEMQKLPSHAKERIALMSASAIALVIFILWLVSFFRSVAEQSNDPRVLGQAKNPTVQEVSPFNSLGNTFSSFWSDITSIGKSVPSIDDIQKIKDQVSSTTTESLKEISTTTPSLISTTTETR